MKKILLILFVVLIVSGQSIKDSYNSSTTAIGSLGTYTGYQSNLNGYNSVSVSVWADKNASLQIQMGNMVSGTFTPQKYYIFTYTANDSTFTKSVPAEAPYYRVVLSNSEATDMTSLKLTSMLHKGHNLPITDNGRVEVEIPDTVNINAVGVTVTADSVTVNVPSTITNGTKSVTTSASALASTASAKLVIVTNDNESGIIYWGGSGVTTSNGEPIYPKTSHWIEISDPANVYVIGSTSLTARYKVLN